MLTLNPCLWHQYKILNVPLSSHLAANHFNQQQAEQEERMRMKKLTLDINERQEQEDYQGRARTGGGRLAQIVFMLEIFCVAEMMQSLAQRPAPANTNRERRPRYQHPKGAPNADLIFKTGGRWGSSLSLTLCSVYVVSNEDKLVWRKRRICGLARFFGWLLSGRSLVKVPPTL